MLWQKDTRPEDWVTRFTVGEDYRWDALLLPYDLIASRAHAHGLHAIGILSTEELAGIEEGLDALAEQAARGEIGVRPEDEDCHTVIEQFLTERLGEAGKKIHTGRSRNDQVLAALRLFLRDRLERLGRRTADLGGALCTLAEQHPHTLLPGYTHLQRAMPSTVALWALGFGEALAADLDALRHARAQTNVSPLGSAAGYGVPYLDLPRQQVADRLGFQSVQTHVTAVQLSRGKIELAVVHALVQVGATVNRLAADLVLYNTAEFGFVVLPAEYCTGSSIMPQKQNPDVLELARAAYHRLTAEMHLLAALPANLPSGYHRDLQLTKEAVVRAVLLADDLLTAMNHLLPGVHFREDRLRAATTPELFATAAALEQVQRGVPFRDAYRDAARAVDDLDAPDPQDALDAYRADGFPGRERPDLVRAALARHDAWIAELAE